MTEEIRRTDVTEKNVGVLRAFLRVPGYVQRDIEGTVRRPRDLPFLALLADICRQFFRESFVYLETGAGCGDTICALGYSQHASAAEHYLGVDVYEEEELAAAVQNAMNAGPRQGFQSTAFLEGYHNSPAAVSRVRASVSGEVHMLFINGADDLERVEADFSQYADMVAPGGIVVFSNYWNNEHPSVTEAVDHLDKSGWNVVGPLVVTKQQPTLYVLQRELG